MKACPVFKIPTSNGKAIVFVPKRKKLLLVPEGVDVCKFEKETISNQQEEKPPDYHFKACHLIVNNYCNLRCVYCYAMAGEYAHLEMPLVLAMATVKRLVKNIKSLGQEVFETGFIGGEPTLSMKLVKKVTANIRQLADKERLRARIGIVSNGYFNSSVSDFIRQNMDYVTISLDGPAEIHNRQRPTLKGEESFDKVYRNAKYLHDSGIAFGIRCTVTSKSVACLPDIILYLHENFPNATIGLEPLQECGRCSLSHESGPDMEQFTRKMIEVIKMADVKRIKLKSSFLRFKINEDIVSFCGVNGQNFAITPDGYVTACTRVTSRHDKGAELFHFGWYNHESEQFEFDESKYSWLKTIHVDSIADCEGCFAKFNCKGDCAAIKSDMHGADLAQVKSPRCESIKKLTLALFKIRLGLET